MDREEMLGITLDVVVTGFRALEFMGRHSHAVNSGMNLCAQCSRASVDSYIGIITVEEAADRLCDELKQAINQYKTSLLIVEKWERTGQPVS